MAAWPRVSRPPLFLTQKLDANSRDKASVVISRPYAGRKAHRVDDLLFVRSSVNSRTSGAPNRIFAHFYFIGKNTRTDIKGNVLDFTQLPFYPIQIWLVFSPVRADDPGQPFRTKRQQKSSMSWIQMSVSMWLAGPHATFSSGGKMDENVEDNKNY